MKMLLFSMMGLTVVLAVTPCLADEPLANANLDGLYAKSIDEVLRLPPEQIDLGTSALIVSEAWSDMVAGRRYQQQLDDIATEIRSQLKTKNAPMGVAAIPIINDYLFNELKFKTINKATDPYDLFLHSVMDRHQGYCLSLSVLYLAIGERLGLPLYGVVVPGHFFVRYDDGKTRFNIEATHQGNSAPDSYYLEQFNVPKTGTIYMTNLNKRQTLGCFFNNLGNVYKDINNVNQAMASMQWAVYINPSLAESRMNLGNIYLLKNRVDDAITEYQAATKISPDDAKSHYNLGNAYQRREWFNDAINEYTAAIRLDPNVAEAYLGMGVCYDKLNQPENEIDAYFKALAVNPNMYEAMANLGNVYFNKGDFDAAIEQYSRAARVKPDNAEIYYQLGVAYFQKGDYANAIRSHLKTVELAPKMADAHYALGLAYYKTADYDLALKHIKIAERLGKTIDPDILKVLESKK
ncbi:MAG: tetratricopeptide repeat protein [Sedimentisphaerales bacterium]|jgi:tetratricopeptide (TPR) repeat protein